MKRRLKEITAKKFEEIWIFVSKFGEKFSRYFSNSLELKGVQQYGSM